MICNKNNKNRKNKYWINYKCRLALISSASSSLLKSWLSRLEIGFRLLWKGHNQLSSLFKSKQSDSPREARGTKKTRIHLAPQHKHNESKLELPFNWSGWCSNHFVCIFTDPHHFNSMHRCWPPCSRVWSSCQRRVHISLASLVLISRLTLLKILISYVKFFS